LRVRVTLYSKIHMTRGEKATAEVFVEPEIAGVKRETKTVKDERGNVIFDVMVITDEYSWDCASESALTSREDGKSVIERFADQGMLAGYQDVLALGTASHEGDLAHEDARADRRADKLGEWIAASAKDSAYVRLGVYSVNLGQIRGAGDPSTHCSDKTASERPLVIIGVIRRDAGTNIELGLERVFSENRSEKFFGTIFKYYPPPWKLKRIKR
jgi:hypothetical protein